MTVQYRPRNDNVIIRKVKRGKVRGLHMPDQSAEGVDFFVVAAGPKVEDLEAGDRVMIMGRGTETYYPVPGEPDLIVIQEKMVAYKITAGVAGA